LDDGFPSGSGLFVRGGGVVRHSSSFERSALPRRAIVGMLAVLVGIALFPCGVAAADTVATNFESFATGSVNGQGGWKSAAPTDVPSCFPTPTLGQYDQAVVKNSLFYPSGVAGFDQQSLRMSNACGTGEFTFQTYSNTTKEPAGEETANKEFTAQFSFITTTTAYQPGLYLSVSPVPADVGARMSWVGLTETEEGTEVGVADVPSFSEGGTLVHPAGEVLKRGVPHTIKFWIKLNPGQDNDLVRISIDGNDVGQCYSSWENYYRHPEVKQEVPNIDSLLFRSNVQVPGLLGKGYLFDNVSVTTANGSGPPGCDVPIEKQADERTVTRGGHVGYRITVRNRGHLSARDYRVCDRIPRGMTFVSADRKLLGVGDRRCLVIPSLAPGQRFSFHVVLRADANAPPGDVDNIAEETPVAPPGLPVVPPLPAAAQDLPGTIGVASAISSAKAIVKVVAKPAARRRAPPPVTG
jgi:uncharacterized repeat protein (TIGR01451 family)